MEVGIVNRRPPTKSGVPFFLLLLAAFGLGATGYHWSLRDVRQQSLDAAILTLRRSRIDSERCGAVNVTHGVARAAIEALQDASDVGGEAGLAAAKCLERLCERAKRR